MKRRGKDNVVRLEAPYKLVSSLLPWTDTSDKILVIGFRGWRHDEKKHHDVHGNPIDTG